jgi:hypothetical protein
LQKIFPQTHYFFARVADSDLGSGAFFTSKYGIWNPGFGMGRKSAFGFVIRDQG